MLPAFRSGVSTERGMMSLVPHKHTTQLTNKLFDAKPCCVAYASQLNTTQSNQMRWNQNNGDTDMRA